MLQDYTVPNQQKSLNHFDENVILNFPQLLLLGLLAVARAAPQDIAVIAETEAPVVVAEPVVTVAEAVLPTVTPIVTPVDYAINTCRTEAEPFETQTCTPHHERVCVSSEVINQVNKSLLAVALV